MNWTNNICLPLSICLVRIVITTSGSVAVTFFSFPRILFSCRQWCSPESEGGWRHVQCKGSRCVWWPTHHCDVLPYLISFRCVMQSVSVDVALRNSIRDFSCSGLHHHKIAVYRQYTSIMLEFNTANIKNPPLDTILRRFYTAHCIKSP
jgi:hypothetical protein